MAIDSGTLPSAAFAVVRDGEIVYENALGWADEEEKKAATVSTPYPLASVTKPIVATALMMLVERGRLDLDAPALRYAGTWSPPDASEASAAAYSLRHLLNHTSGLTTYASIYWRDQDRPVRSLQASFRKYGFPAQPPGRVFEYSNLGYGLIGHIIAEQSGTSLGQALSRELFEPLGMRDTTMVNSFSSPAEAARKYDAGGAALVDTYNDTPGAGNVYSSVHDLALFAAFHLAADADGSPPVLSQESRLLMRSFSDRGAMYPYYDASRYGLGWYFRTNAAGEEVVWHEGGMPGASTIVLLLPEQQVAAAVLINANDKNLQAQTFANALIQVVEPRYSAVSFNPTDGLGPYAGQPGLLGRWEGSVRIDGKNEPCALSFEADGSLTAEFPGRVAGELLRVPATSPPLLYRNLLIATFAATLPASDVAQTTAGFVLLRLLRHGNDLIGAMIAYASPSRLEHLYPFAVRLRRKAE